MNANIVLDKSHLLAFLVRPNVGFPEHYVSSQPLSLYIPYTYYISLVKDLIKLNLDILRTPLSVYKKNIKFGDNSLSMLKLYHFDIALSGLEEIFKSYSKGFPCTRIFSLVDCNSELRIETISFNSSAEFIKTNFTQVERTELHEFIRNYKIIPRSIFSEKGELLTNTYMYYICMALFGVFKMNKDFIITVEEN